MPARNNEPYRGFARLARLRRAPDARYNSCQLCFNSCSTVHKHDTTNPGLPIGSPAPCRTTYPSGHTPLLPSLLATPSWLLCGPPPHRRPAMALIGPPCSPIPISSMPTFLPPALPPQHHVLPVMQPAPLCLLSSPTHTSRSQLTRGVAPVSGHPIPYMIVTGHGPVATPYLRATAVALTPCQRGLLPRQPTAPRFPLSCSHPENAPGLTPPHFPSSCSHPENAPGPTPPPFPSSCSHPENAPGPTPSHPVQLKTFPIEPTCPFP